MFRPTGTVASRQSRWPLLVVVMVLVISLGLDLWWLDAFRRGFPLDIDESRYLELGLRLSDGLRAGGPASLWHVWTAQHDFGPLLPLFSIPVYLVAGHTIIGGLAVQLLFFGVLVLSSYGIGTRLSSPAGGALVAVVVATTPAVIDFSRSYQFAITDAAVLAAATYALLASEALSRRGWALAWGLLLGLAPLARTMAIAFIPAQLVAAVWLILVRPAARPAPVTGIRRGPDVATRRPQMINLALAAVLAVGVAATWLASSWRAVSSYLTNFGYGAQSAHFSHAGSRLSVGYWTREAVNAVGQDLYLPLAALLVLGLMVSAVAALVRRRRTRPGELNGPGSSGRLRGTLLRLAASDHAIVLLILFEGYVVVSSSRNEGVGFRVPLIAMLIALVVSAVLATPWNLARRLLIAAVLAVCGLNLLMKADLIAGLSGSHFVKVPGFGTVATLDGRGYIQDYVLGSLEASYVSSTQQLPNSQKEWLPAYALTVRTIFGLAHRAGYQPVIELATDEPLVNANDFSLAARLHYRRNLAISLLPGPPGTPSPTKYARLLKTPSVPPNILLTVTNVGVSYFALTGLRDVAQGVLERAGAADGFTCGAGIGLPDGRVLVVSWLNRGSPAGAQPPSCSPRVSRTVPADGATGASTTAPIAAVFNLPMESGSLVKAFTLSEGRRRVSGSVTFFGEIAAIFTPRQPLRSGARFTATINTGATAATGAALRAPERWSFTTR